MNIHIFDIDGTLCEEQGILSDKMISYLILLSKKDKVYLNTGRGYKSALNSIKNNSFLKENITFITENGTKYNNLEKIFNFNFLEIEEIFLFIENNLEKINYFDFWLKDKLFTFSDFEVIDEHENRVYLKNFLEFKEIVISNLSFISMFYILLKKGIFHKFINISGFFGENDVILTKIGINKSNILNELKNYKQIFVYGNGNNDLSIFSYNKSNKINIGIGNNKDILKLSDIKLKNYIELEKYLQIKN